MYTLTIVGGGAMSCGYDYPKDKDILTHINGAFHHPKITLDSLIEISEQRQKYILNKWGNSFDIYSSLEDSLSKYKSDIFVVATPTDSHLKIIENILSRHNPLLIICEKPVVSNLNELKMLSKLFDDTNTKIITNFPRRFDPSLNNLKEIIFNMNKIYHFYGTFTKGLIHNGSHMIDLINMLIGDINYISDINKEIINNDYFGQFIVNTDRCNGVITNVNVSKLSIFELTIYTDIAKIEIIGATNKIIIKYVDKLNLVQDFETYSLKDELPITLNKNAYNSFEYAIKLIENDVVYSEFSVDQYSINKLIFDTQKKLMEQL